MRSGSSTTRRTTCSRRPRRTSTACSSRRSALPSRTARKAPPRSLLDDVTDLFALSTIESHRGWYLEHGRLTPVHSKAVIHDVGVLCKDLAPHARTLVDAFAIPDAWLGAPGLLDPLPTGTDA